MKIDDTRNGYIKIDVGIDRAWEGGWLKVTGLTVKQQEYAAADVLHLHQLKRQLDIMLEREGRNVLISNLN